RGGTSATSSTTSSGSTTWVPGTSSSASSWSSRPAESHVARRARAPVPCTPAVPPGGPPERRGAWRALSVLPERGLQGHRLPDGGRRLRDPPAARVHCLPPPLHDDRDLEPLGGQAVRRRRAVQPREGRSEEHTSELQSRENLVCRLLLEKKN